MSRSTPMGPSKLKERIIFKTFRLQELNHSTNEFTKCKSIHNSETMQSMKQKK